MSTDVIDLSGVLRPDLRVKFEQGGTIYRLPGDPPSEEFLRIGMLLRELSGLEATEESAERAKELREELGEAVDDLFALKNADYEPGEIRLPDRQLIALFNQLSETYSQAVAEALPEEVGEDARPTSPETRSATRSSRRSASRRPRQRRSTSSPSSAS